MMKAKLREHHFMYFVLISVLCATYCMSAFAVEAEYVTSYYVSPQGNNETGDGSLEKPWQTIDYVKTKVQETIQSGIRGNIEVNLMGGVYVQSGAIAFGEADSPNEPYKVIYKGYGSDMPVISGGETVSGWEHYSGNIYKTNVGDRIFHFITENGTQAVKARYPDKGYLTAIGNKSKNSFYLPENSAVPTLSAINGLETYIWSGSGIAWFSDTVSVSSYNDKTNYIELDGNIRYVIGDGARFYLQGALEFLDSPGEFYLDQETNDLYYYPYGDINESEIVVANNANVIEFCSDSDNNRVKNIELRGIEINTADRGFSGVYMQNADNIEIIGCRITNVGHHGVFLDGAVSNCKVKNCEISNIGYDGVMINNLPQVTEDKVTLTTYSKNNEIINCNIYSGGKLVGDGCGVQIYDSAENTVSHCHIFDFPRYGLSIKGVKAPSVLKTLTVEGVAIDETNFRMVQHSQDNIIMYNDVHDVNTDSQDTGVFETWCSDIGNIVMNNHFHSSGVTFSEGYGIYLDDAATGFTVKNNIIDNLQKFGGGELGAAILAKGIDNIIEGNIIANNNGYGALQVLSMSGEKNYGIQFFKNTVYNSGNFVYRSASTYEEGRISKADDNIFYNDDKRYDVIGVDSSVKNIWDWQEFGGKAFDGKSQLDVDPMFYNADGSDYRFSYNSPSYKNNIEDIDEGEIGLTQEYPFTKAESVKKLYLDEEDDGIYGSVISVEEGEKIELSVFARSENGYRFTPQNIGFSVSNSDIAQCDMNVLTGISKGKTVLTISSEGKTLTYDVFVSDKPTEIKMDCGNKQIKAGSFEPINIYAVTELGRIIKNNVDFKLESTDEAILSVNEATITAQSTGTAAVNISAEADGITLQKTISFEVCDNVLESVTLESDMVLLKGESKQIQASANYSDGTQKLLNASDVEFSVLDERILAVDENGTVTGLRGGNTVVFAKYSEGASQTTGRFIYSVREAARNPSEKQYGSDCDDYYGVNVNVSDNTDIVGGLDGGDWILYASFDFGERDYTDVLFSIGVPNEYAGSPVYMRLDSKNGPLIAQLNVESTGAFSKMSEQSADIIAAEKITGVHDIYFKFSKTGTGNIAWFKFISETEDCLQGVDYAAFDNGVKLPNDGIPSYFGDINVFFAEKMKSDSIENAVTVTDESGNVLDISIEAASENCRIKDISSQLLPATKYNLQVKASALLTADGRGGINDYCVAFTTSSDLTKQQPVFEDSFENGLDNWTGSGGVWNETSSHTGGKSVTINKTKDGDTNDPFVINTAIPENGVYEAWIYDDAVTLKTVLLNLTGTDSDGNEALIRLGIKDTDYYVFSDVKSSLQSTGVKRTVGWHRFVIDFTNPDETKAYIDGVCVVEKNTSLKKAQQFGFLNLWRINSGTILADDVKIWNAADYNILSDTDRAFVCNEYLSPLNSFNGGDKIYVAARVENNTDNNENATILIAEYESGCPITVKLSDTISILPGKADIIKLSYTIPNDIENKQIKAFLWKDVSSLVPIAEHTNIN